MDELRHAGLATQMSSLAGASPLVQKMAELAQEHERKCRHLLHELSRLSGESVEQVRARLARLPVTLEELYCYYMAFGQWPAE
ncbi:MAG: hypothetical protein ACYSVY_00180 [Planctomycetota bacterium]|jgi:hypothetical protein